jgi:multidrug transporter EmrE-like cation transporter
MWWLMLGGILLTVGDILMKKWVASHMLGYAAVGMVVWIASLVCLAISFKEQNIAVASMILVIVNFVTLAIVSWIYFSEPITLIQGTGIALGLAAVVLLWWA